MTTEPRPAAEPRSPEEVFQEGDRTLLLREVRTLSSDIARLTAQASNLERVVVPREEQKRRRKQAALFGAMVVMVIVAAFGYDVHFTRQVNDRNDKLVSTIVSNCTQRNASTAKVFGQSQNLNDLLGGIATTLSSPATDPDVRAKDEALVAQIHAYLAQQPSAAFQTDCNSYAKTNGTSVQTPTPGDTK